MITNPWEICDWKYVIYSDKEKLEGEKEWRENKNVWYYQNAMRKRKKSLTNYFKRDTIRKMEIK
jgi:hypothetical protein